MTTLDEREQRTLSKAEAQAGRPVERQRIMQELAKQHGLKYCPCCDMCLGKAFFHRDAASPDGLRWCCKACQKSGLPL